MLRLAAIPLLGALVAMPAMAQGYYPYGYTEYRGAPSAAHEEWYRARRAEDMARWRAANGDYEGANRAHNWANLHRERARQDAWAARGGW